MRTPTRAATALATALLLGTVVSGCSAATWSARGPARAGDGSAAEVLASAHDAMGELRSMRVEGRFWEETGPVQLDLALDDGGCAGTVSYGVSTVELLGVDGRAWMRADARFWRDQAGEGGEQALALVGDRWLPLTSGDGFREFCDLDRFVENTFSGGLMSDDTSQLTLGAVSSIDGVEVVAITEEADLSRAYGYVETGGRHRFVRMVVTGAGSGDISFTDFDEPLGVRAPRPRDIADLGPLDGLDGV